MKAIWSVVNSPAARLESRLSIPVVIQRGAELRGIRHLCLTGFFVFITKKTRLHMISSSGLLQLLFFLTAF